jgi:membrane protease YdiL (CAAX protease family)
MVLVIFGTIGLSEEIFFRGILQTFLDKNLDNKKASLMLASAIFGMTHVYKHHDGVYFHNLNWAYAGMATVAGLAYGLTYRYTGSIFWAILVHALVDTIWRTMFS